MLASPQYAPPHVLRGELKNKQRLLIQQLDLVNKKCEKLSRIVENRLRKNGVMTAPVFTPLADNEGGNRDLNASKRDRLSRHAPVDRVNLLEPTAAQVKPAAVFKRGPDLEARQKRNTLRSVERKMRLGRRVAEEQSRGGMTQRRAAPPKPPQSSFPSRYDRGEVPCSVEHGSAGGRNALVWDVPLDQLDYDFYIPLFSDGIRCVSPPLQFIARQGLLDLVESSADSPKRVLSCLAELMASLRLALLVNNTELSAFVCQVLRELASLGHAVGDALVGHLKLVLCHLNKHVHDSRNVMEFGAQHQPRTFAVVIEETLQRVEAAGGPKAFPVIRKYIPAYLSVL
jgi:hypothetical protein